MQRAIVPPSGIQLSTNESQAALKAGLQWLATNQQADGGWGTNDLGLVGLGTLAFLAQGEVPGGTSAYARNVEKGLRFLIEKQQPSGLLNIATSQRDMYNHGLATFVLSQAYGSGSHDSAIAPAIKKAVALTIKTQAKDGGWDYEAKAKSRGHDLSLLVMQAKALRGARDCGIFVDGEAVSKALTSVRKYYHSATHSRSDDETIQRTGPGQFGYGQSPGGDSLAMAAAGVVCLQEFGQYEDWRIEKNLEVIRKAIHSLGSPQPGDGTLPFDAYTTYYVAHAIYHAGGTTYQECYPILRDYLLSSKVTSNRGASFWFDKGFDTEGRVNGKSSKLFGTAVACFVLAMPNRFLPVLQEGESKALLISGLTNSAGSRGANR